MIPNLSKLRPVKVADLIRVGRENDGGYVVSARTLQNITLLLGFGINVDWSFETDFLNRSPSTALLAVDGSVSTKQFFKEAMWHRVLSFIHLAKGHMREASAERKLSREYKDLRKDFAAFFRRPGRLFIEKMISDADGWTGEYWANVVRAAKSLDASAAPRWFVKMDIEGAEYRVLPEMMESAETISGVVIEFHDCDLLAERFDEIVQLLQTEFVIVHVHGNNHAPLAPGSACPRVLELSLMNRRLVTQEEMRSPNTLRYPLDLDQSNRAGVADYVFLPDA